MSELRESNRERWIERVGKRHVEWKKGGGGSWVFLGASEERKMRHMNTACFI